MPDLLTFALVAFFSFLAGGFTLWALLELHVRREARRGLRQAADEAAALNYVQRERERQLAEDPTTPAVPWPHNMRDE